jgi:hypothetical protein
MKRLAWLIFRTISSRFIKFFLCRDTNRKRYYESSNTLSVIVIVRTSSLSFSYKQFEWIKKRHLKTLFKISSKNKTSLLNDSQSILKSRTTRSKELRVCWVKRLDAFASTFLCLRIYISNTISRLNICWTKHLSKTWIENRHTSFCNEFWKSRTILKSVISRFLIAKHTRFWKKKTFRRKTRNLSREHS